MRSWVRVADVAQFRQGRGRRVDVDGRKIAVFKDADRWFALDDACPHMGASLSDGTLYGSQLQCVWHEWRYDTTTGQCPVRPWARVTVHDVKIENGGVFVRRTDEPEKGVEEGEAEPDWTTWEPEKFFKKKPADGQ